MKSFFTAADAGVNSWAVSIHSSSFTLVAGIIAYGFDTVVLLVASVLMAAYLFYRSYGKSALLFVGAMGGIAAIVTVVKALVHSERPLDSVIHEAGFSFPSGHVTCTVVFFGLLTFWCGSVGRVLWLEHSLWCSMLCWSSWWVLVGCILMCIG